MKKKSTKEEVVFSEKEDKSINGYAIGATFAIISAFLFVNKSYLHYDWLTYIFGAFFGMFGLLGIGIEVDKTKSIKGTKFISVGLVLLTFWFLVYKNTSSGLLNFFILLLLVFGCYGLVLGVFQMMYSLFLGIKESKKSFIQILKFVFIGLTQVCSLFLTILNILKIFKLI